MKAVFNWLSSNIGSLVLTLVLSITVWIVANQQLNPVEPPREIDEPVDIELVGLNPDYVISNEPPTQAIVLLVAQQNTWPSISAEDVAAQVNLEGLEPGDYRIPLNVELSNVQAVVDSTRPNQVRVIIEERIERELEIVGLTQGVVASGYTQLPVELEPSSITIVGPRSAVEAIETLQVTADIDELRSDFVEEIIVTPMDVEGQVIGGVALSPDRVLVRVPISQQPGIRDFAVQVPTVGRPEEGYFFTGLTVEPTVITLEGNPTTIENLGSTVETQTIDLSDLRADLTLNVPLDLPLGVQAAEGQPSTVSVNIRITPQSGSLLLEGIPVDVENLTLGLAANIIDDEVEVLVAGPQPLLDELTVEQIRVVVDLTALQTGTFFVEPEATIAGDEDLSVESILPSTIEVRIGTVRGP